MSPASRFVTVLLCSGWTLLTWGVAALTTPWVWPIGMGVGLLVAGGAFGYALVVETRNQPTRAANAGK